MAFYNDEQSSSHRQMNNPRLLWIRASQRDQHIGNILLRAMIDLARYLQPVRARERFEQRGDIIAQLAVADPALLQKRGGPERKNKTETIMRDGCPFGKPDR